MGNGRLPHRAMFGKVGGGKRLLGRARAGGWMGLCLESDLSLYNMPTEAKRWALAAKLPGQAVQTCRGRRREVQQYTHETLVRYGNG